MKNQRLSGDESHTAKKNESEAVKPYEMAVRYQQNSAEVHALQVQAYNVAKERLDDYLKNKQGGKKPAVVLDLDETVLDNMPLAAKGITEGFDYTEWGEDWQNWVDAASANLIPGAKDFLNHANERGVKIFYISNRLAKNQKPTIENMKKLGLPQVSKDNVMLWGESGTKKERRRKIRKHYDILLLIGNSLYDLSSEFIHRSTKQQIATVEKRAEEFGKRFIILPNSAYGDYWVDAKLEAWEGGDGG